MDPARTTRLRRIEIAALILAGPAFLAMTCALAQIRLFWYDEIFTRQVVQLGSWKRIVAALHHGIDRQPPFFFFITSLTHNIGGEEIGLRLSAILGFMLAGISLYLIARRWFSPAHAMGVAVTPSILFFGTLGLEARPYGFVLGCAALAVLSWTFRDRWPTAGRIGYLSLAGILGAAVTHYYAFVIAVPFGAAAAWTLWRKRRLDLWTILGCLCAALSDLWNLGLIRHTIAIYKDREWSRSSWHVALQMALHCDDLRGKMVFGSDPARSLVYSSSDTTDKAMLLLRESPPLRIEPLEPFLREQRRRLLVYHSPFSLPKNYFSDYPEYAPRLHVLEEGEAYPVYRLDPAAPPAVTSGGER